LEDTIRSFREILSGEYDTVPERFFMFRGSIDEVKEAWAAEQAKTNQPAAV
ncbi:MAG: hypothetical protein JWM98_1848, partial [Thermoleophilia bacterium]|nr:hypothetical protein [Thermoleophilia bacterium]